MARSKGGIFSALRLQVYRLTSTGIGVGQLNPSSLTPGAVSHAFLVDGFVQSGFPEIAYGLYRRRGDQKVKGQADMGVTDIGTFEITLANYDADLAAVIASAVKDTTTITNATISAPNTGKQIPNRVGAILTGQFQSGDEDDLNEVYYFNVVFPSLQMRMRLSGLSQNDGDNPNPVTLVCTPSYGRKFPGGNAFSANQGWENFEEVFYAVVADYPYSYTAFVQDGTEDTYVLGWLPAYNSANNAHHIHTVGGTVTALTSLSTTTAEAVLAAAGSSGVVAGSFYKTGFVDVP